MHKKINQIIIIVLLCLVSIELGIDGSDDGFQLISGTLSHKGTNVMGVDVDYALMDLEFDRPLYHYMSIPCANYTCAKPANNIDCTCDYTDPYNCPRTASGSPTCPPCPTSYYNSRSGNMVQYCSGQQWQTITYNKQYNFSLAYGEQINLRIKANSSTCQGTLLYMSQTIGWSFPMMAPYPIFQRKDGRYNAEGLYRTKTSLTFCPTDNPSWTYQNSWTNNTYFISVIADSTISAFSLTLYSGDVPAPVVPSNPVCTPVTPYHTCINDGVLISQYSNGQTNNFYSYQVTKPEVVSIMCPALYESTNIYISEDINEPYPNISNHKWGVSHGRDLSITLTLKPINDTTPRTLFINLYPDYDTNFQCVLTTTAKRYLRPLVDNTGVGGTYMTVGNSRLLTPEGYVLNTIYDFSYTYTSLFPRHYNNPLMPIPTQLSFLKDAGDFSLFTVVSYNETDNPAKPNSFQAAYLLSYKQNSDIVNSELETILASKIEFLNMVVDANGTALEGQFGFQLQQPSCDYKLFQETVDAIDSFQDQTFNSTSYRTVTSLRYAIDTLTLRDTWYGCQLQATDLLATHMVNETQLTTACLYSPSDLEYDLDPCCNSTLEFFQCCTPKEMQVPVKQITGVKSSMVEDTCSSPDCTSSILGDYFNSIQAVDNGECSLTLESLYFYQLNMVDNQRVCKQVYEMTPCQNDTSCPTGVKCDLYLRECQIPMTQRDKQYIECVLSKSTKATIYYLKFQQNLTGDSIPELVDEIYDKFSWYDCSTPFDSSASNFYRYESSYSQTKRCYPSPQCQDKSCIIQHDVCFDGYYSGYTFQRYAWPQSNCESMIGFCSDAKYCWNNVNCKANCQARPQFCGYCQGNDTICYDFSTSLHNSTECSSTPSVCLLKDGYYYSGLTPQQCKQSGYCSKSCGSYCDGISGCVDTTSTSQSNCQTKGGIWYTNQVCLFPISQSQCALKGAGFEFYNCSTMSVSECYAPYGDNPAAVNFCWISKRACTTKQECEQSDIGGSCSDEFYFNRVNTPQYTTGFGKCVHDHYVYHANWQIPTCEKDSENDSPMGCYLTYPEKFNKTECENQPGYRWWEPAYTKSECEGRMGCEIMDNSYKSLSYSRRFNQMNETQCTSCLANSEHEWKSMFTWTPGVWYEGIPVQPSWMNARYIPNGYYDAYFQPQSFYDALDLTFYSQVTNQLRSASLCRIKRLEQNLESITCSCSGPGGSQCFTTSAMVLGQSNPCAGEQSTFHLSYGQIIFTVDSVTYACTNALISQVGRSQFRSTVGESLSSSFVSYRKPDNYELLNDNGATIGKILSDGIKINVKQVRHLIVCMDSDSDDKYPVLDVASATGDELTSSSSSDVLKPLEITVYRLGDYQCGNVTFDPSQETYTYFIVSRMESYKDQKKVLFDKASLGLIYTLAVIFLLISIWGVFQLLVSSWRVYQHEIQFELVHILIVTTTLFILIRTFYFFILPSGKLQSQVSDYILVVLPTFIYFTSFTQIIVLWYVYVKVASHRDILTRIKRVLLLVNTVFYLLFIIIVLVFNFTKKKVQNDCGGRLELDIAKATQPQRIVSIFYAVVQATISLVIGAAFIYLGGSIYLLMKTNDQLKNRDRSRGSRSFKSTDGNGTGSSGGGSSGGGSGGNSVHATSRSKRGFTIITWICSIGFILHCVFVLVLVAANPSNMAFSFVGLLVTEILPALAILYSYNQARFKTSRVLDRIGLSRMSSNTTSTSSASTGSGSGVASSSSSSSQNSRKSSRMASMSNSPPPSPSLSTPSTPPTSNTPPPV